LRDMRTYTGEGFTREAIVASPRQSVAQPSQSVSIHKMVEMQHCEQQNDKSSLRCNTIASPDTNT
jgi:hypothetical protein